MSDEVATDFSLWVLMQFGKWHGRPAREDTRKMRVPTIKLHQYQSVIALRREAG